MEIQFIAGHGPVTRTPDEGVGFWSRAFGIELEKVGPDYFHARGLDGAKVFGLWPLAQAAEATFGTPTWPDDRPVPQSWVEFELASQAVGAAEQELRAARHEILTPTHEEPRGQTTARLQSPEGVLVGLSHLPAFHR